MTDDAEVSEEVIRQMGNEIIRLREQLAALRNQLGRAEDTDQLLALIAQEKKRADDAVCERDLANRRLVASERALQRALAYAPLSLSPSSTRPSPKSIQCNLPSNAISGSESGEDWIHDDPKHLEQLKEVVRERDAALLELTQLKQSMRHLEFGLSDLEDGLSDSGDNNATHEGSQMQIARSISKELVLTPGKDSRTVNDPITTIPMHLRGSNRHVNANIAPILADVKETRVLKSVLNTNRSLNDPFLLASNKPVVSGEMQRIFSPPLHTRAPDAHQNALTSSISIIITENTDPIIHTKVNPNSSSLAALPGIPGPVPPSYHPNLTEPRGPIQDFPVEPLLKLSQPQTPEDIRQNILALFPVPAGYPPTALQPISLPATLNLHAFLDQATGSAKQSLIGHRQYLSHQVTWCTRRPYHCYILVPRYIYKPSPLVSSSSSLRSRSASLSPASASSDSQGPWDSVSQRSVSNTVPSRSPDYLDVLHPLNQGNTLGRWIETDGTGGMRDRSAEIFYQQHGEWFYVGTFKAHRLPDLASDEFACLDERTKGELIQGTLGAAHATAGVGARAGSLSGDEPFDGRTMYNSGVLKVACVGLQCIGFNDALNRIMHAQSRLLVQGRTLRASSASSYLDSKEKRNVSDVRVCITPHV